MERTPGHPGAAAINGPEILIPLSFFAVSGGILFSVTPIGRALARRIGGGAPDAEHQREVTRLREEVADLRAELDDVRAGLGHVDELHERLDFAERLLAQQRGRDALPGGGP